MIYRSGDRVAVYHDNRTGYLVFGTVVSSEISKEDMSYHGSPWHPEITRVKCDDGLIIETFTAGVHFTSISDFIYMLEEDIRYLQDRIDVCKKQIEM